MKLLTLALLLLMTFVVTLNKPKKNKNKVPNLTAAKTKVKNVKLTSNYNHASHITSGPINPAKLAIKLQAILYIIEESNRVQKNSKVIRDLLEHYRSNKYEIINAEKKRRAQFYKNKNRF